MFDMNLAIPFFKPDQTVSSQLYRMDKMAQRIVNGSIKRVCRMID
jgi:hypothetical protein